MSARQTNMGAYFQLHPRWRQATRRTLRKQATCRGYTRHIVRFVDEYSCTARDHVTWIGLSDVVDVIKQMNKFACN